MDSDQTVHDKLNTYSLKFTNANQKFEEAFRLIKEYKKAVNKMRYEFTASLSVNQKRLLDKEGCTRIISGDFTNSKMGRNKREMMVLSTLSLLIQIFDNLTELSGSEPWERDI